MLSRKEDIIRMFLEGFTVSDISIKFSNSEEVITNIWIDYRRNRLIKIFEGLSGDGKDVTIDKYIKDSLYKIYRHEDKVQRRKIINIIKLSEDGMVMSDIGNVFGLSRERIRQILNKYAPEIIAANEIKKYRICEVCNEEKKGVHDRNGHKLICQDCYKRLVKAKKRKWSKKYTKCIDCGTTRRPHHIRGRCRRCHYKYEYHYNLKRKKSITKSGEKWRKKNKDKVRASNKKASLKQAEKRFSGNRYKAMERDGFICQKCGMNREMSIEKYNRDLYVKHIGDKNDNSIDNLITICLVCHSAINREEMEL